MSREWLVSSSTLSERSKAGVTTSSGLLSRDTTLEDDFIYKYFKYKIKKYNSLKITMHDVNSVIVCCKTLLAQHLYLMVDLRIEVAL